MGRLLLLVQVSRPILWPVLPLVYSLGMQAAKAPLSAMAIAQMLLLTFPMNLIGCGLNDLHDYESDRRSRRRRAIWGAMLTDDDRPLVWQACIAMMPIVILGGLISRNQDNFVTTVSVVLMAWIYSVPPLRLKERPPLDSIANGLGYFLFPFSMGYSLGADIRTIPTRYYFLTLCVCGIHALASAVDYEADRAAGQRTIAVVAGKRVAAVLAFCAFLVTVILVEFPSVPVRVFMIASTIATAVAAAIPRERVILGACVVIFVGFVAAATLDLVAFVW